MYTIIVDLKEEVGNRATPALYATIYQEGNNTCLYGVCHYCSPVDPVCGTGNVLEGALIFWLPRYLRLVKHRHPWQRTYKRNKVAAWEVDEDYCDKVFLLLRFKIYKNVLKCNYIYFIYIN